MTEQVARDLARFLTTLPQWDRAAFFHEVGQAAGALAAVRVVPRDSSARGRAVTDAIGAGVQHRWPALVDALSSWPGAMAQRGGWDNCWIYVPGKDPDLVGERLAAALRTRGEPHLTGQLVVVPVDAGAPAAEAAVRAIEDELEHWHHGDPGQWQRWTDAG